jgi:hypothetical protein
MTIGLFALTVAAIFFGAAFYVNFAEQPARLALDDRSLLMEWKPAYNRGLVMQASLAVIGFVLGLLATLMAIDPAAAGPDSRKLIQNWSVLHAVRTALALLRRSSSSGLCCARLNKLTE